MKRYVVLDKKVGETPLMALSAWKGANPAYAVMSASYAGRLDPMASGKLLVLLGYECKKQKNYTKLDKEYEIEVLLDIGSDTGDALGIVERSGQETRPDSVLVKSILKREIGSHERAYPAFSSKTVSGKPLFLHALEGKLHEIQIPMHEERIYGITLVDMRRMSSADLRMRIEKFLALVPKSDEPSKALGADFRIDAARSSWERVFEDTREYTLVRLKVTCASGTYMRSLAARIGEALETLALALSIHRTKIGKYWNGFWVVKK